MVKDNRMQRPIDLIMYANFNFRISSSIELTYFCFSIRKTKPHTQSSLFHQNQCYRRNR